MHRRLSSPRAAAEGRRSVLQGAERRATTARARSAAAQHGVPAAAAAGGKAPAQDRALRCLTQEEITRCRAEFESYGEIGGEAVAERLRWILMKLGATGPQGFPRESDIAAWLAAAGHQQGAKLTLAQFLRVVDETKERLTAVSAADDGAAWDTDVFGALGGEAGNVCLDALRDLCGDFGVVLGDGDDGMDSLSPRMAPGGGKALSFGSRGRLVPFEELKLLLQDSSNTDDTILTFIALGAQHPQLPGLAARLNLDDEREAGRRMEQLREDWGDKWCDCLYVSEEDFLEHAPHIGMAERQVEEFLERAAGLDSAHPGLVQYPDFARWCHETQVRELQQKRGRVRDAARKRAVATDAVSIDGATAASAAPDPTVSAVGSPRGHIDELRAPTTTALLNRMRHALQGLWQKQLGALHDLPQRLRRASATQRPSWVPPKEPPRVVPTPPQFSVQPTRILSYTFGQTQQTHRQATEKFEGGTFQQQRRRSSYYSPPLQSIRSPNDAAPSPLSLDGRPARSNSLTLLPSARPDSTVPGDAAFPSPSARLPNLLDLQPMDASLNRQGGAGDSSPTASREPTRPAGQRQAASGAAPPEHPRELSAQARTATGILQPPARDAERQRSARIDGFRSPTSLPCSPFSSPSDIFSESKFPLVRNRRGSQAVYGPRRWIPPVRRHPNPPPLGPCAPRSQRNSAVAAARRRRRLLQTGAPTATVRVPRGWAVPSPAALAAAAMAADADCAAAAEEEWEELQQQTEEALHNAARAQCILSAPPEPEWASHGPLPRPPSRGRAECVFRPQPQQLPPQHWLALPPRGAERPCMMAPGCRRTAPTIPPALSAPPAWRVTAQPAAG
eukprot:TRINITY_DN8887_c0_g1_i1.p1 TRINITY_DN8887_c0_g1~~TRINITY_DN8887_c0_g1_i1.p1  ORF type:complete len:847 (+),score=143.37 TRINITY_DN8887_c0_g1_i1:82-2622(+)